LPGELASNMQLPCAAMGSNGLAVAAQPGCRPVPVATVCPPPCRYCDAACAKAHWKHHKASCKREAAARQGGQQQQEGSTSSKDQG